MSKKVISFSLWGDDPKYTIGAIRNAILAVQYYPDWICRFYIGKSVPMDIIRELRNMNNTELFIMNEYGDWTSMFWRFYTASDPDVEIMISRDTDSRISRRECLAVQEWLESGKGFHIMRDHPWHGTEILGGMWGMRKGVVPNFQELITKFKKGNFYNTDQFFLKENIYPLIKDNSMIHDEFHNYDLNKKHFPEPRQNYEFVGEVFDYQDNRTISHTRALLIFDKT